MDDQTSFYSARRTPTVHPGKVIVMMTSVTVIMDIKTQLKWHDLSSARPPRGKELASYFLSCLDTIA